MPSRPLPMLSATMRDLPAGDGWIRQPKWDGYRLLIDVRADRRPVAWSRHGTSLTGRLGGLEDCLAAHVPAETLLDGELVAVAAGPDGPVQDFAAVGAATFGRRATTTVLHFVAFDVLRAGGEDVTAQPWERRDAHLRALLVDAPPQIAAIATLPASIECHHQVVALGFEGTILKQRRSIYRPGRHTSWRKHKARHQLDVEVVAVSRGASGQLRATCIKPGDPRPFSASIPNRRMATELQHGGPAVLAYSRVDANGALREAHLLAQRQRTA